MAWVTEATWNLVANSRGLANSRGFTKKRIPYHVHSYWGLNNYPKMKHCIGVIFRVEGFILYVKKMQYLGGFIIQRSEEAA